MSDDVIELGIEVSDPDEMTTFDDLLQIFITELPSGMKIGWDICGCGNAFMSCSCEPILLPRHVLKMRMSEKTALQARETDARLDRLARAALKAVEPLPASQTAE